MDLGDPDPSNHRTGLQGADEIVDWFKEINLMIGGNVTKFLMFTKESCGPCGLVKKYINALDDDRAESIEEIYLEEVINQSQKRTLLLLRSMV